jgi:hypothetical protein
MKRSMEDEGEEQQGMDLEEYNVDPYFEGYVKPSIHRVMLEDGPRM